ncbi:MAG: single-stranded DNA-binding protein [Bacteroidota bacterium]
MNVRNHIHLTGNLGENPKTVILDSGTIATAFSLATNEYYRDKEGNRQTRTEWHRIKAYGKLAELFTEHLMRGSQISIVGSMRYRRWTDEYDQQRVTAEVVAEEFTFLSKSKQSGRSAEEATIAAAVVGAESSVSDPAISAKTTKRRKKTTTTIVA